MDQYEENAAVMASYEEGGWVERTLTIDEVLRFATRVFPLMTAISLVPYLLLWGIGLPSWSGFLEAVGSIVIWSLIALAVYAASALLHEALHVIAMILFARVPISSLKFGVRLREGVLYVHSDRTMSARAYRGVLLLPGLIQGAVPIVLGTIWGTGWLVLYGYVMLVSAVGDIAVLDRMKTVHRDARVRDHPEKIGFLVRQRKDASADGQRGRGD